MIKIKKRIFWQSFYLSSVIFLCCFFGCVGIARAYEKTMEIGFGEYKKAVSYDGESIRILDFEIGKR